MKGRIIDSLKWNGDPRPLKFELMAAYNFIQKGWKVFFKDFEQEDNFDLLLRKRSFSIEVECKTVSGDSGSAIHHFHASNFFEENCQHLMPFSEGCCRVFDFIFEGRLPTRAEDHRRIIEAAIKEPLPDSRTVTSEF